VAQPTARLEVAGADGLQEYPPKAMTGYETYMEGHGVFRASASTDAYTHTGFAIWKAFNKLQGNEGWHSGEGYVLGGSTDPYSYLANTGGALFNVANVTRSIGGINGQWIKLDCPQRIILKNIVLQNRTLTTVQAPKDFTILGSNNDSDWDILQSYVDVTSSTSGVTHEVNSRSSYKYFALVTTRVQHTTDVDLVIGEWRLFGTPAPSSLEDGHLTLGKALTAPRLSGHGAGAETPRAESLVVHYDTTVDSVVSGTTVVDISGNGLNGTLNGAVYDTTERAFTFDGVDDYVSGTLNNPSGAWVHSVSCWYKPLSTTEGIIWTIGTNSVNKQLAVNNANGTIKFYIYGCDATSSPTTSFTTDKWHHIVAIFKNSETTATGGTVTGRELYIDGVKQTLTATNTQRALSLDANTTFRLANQYNSLYNNGSISNFKLWGGVALTAEEVAQEYALGRTGKSLNVTDTAVCLGGTVPRAQLDVRGSIAVDGIVGTSTTGGLVIPSGTTAQLPTVASAGMIRFNTEVDKLQIYNGSVWFTLGGVNATGGVISIYSGYQIHTFGTSGTFNVFSPGNIEYLVVAGGGAGGTDRGGGGGGGGVLTGTMFITSGVYTITIGAGGSPITEGSTSSGTNSSFGTIITAIGGGGGGYEGGRGANGGSGGGSGYGGGTGGSGITGQGNRGGSGYSTQPYRTAGGGGGAGAPGKDGSSDGTNAGVQRPDGGFGIQSTINGITRYYADGGGGGRCDVDSAGSNTGGSGIGGSGTGGSGAPTTTGYGYAGLANRGSGGGGGGASTGYVNGGAGGSGIVIIRYLL